jgi:phosphate transport system substrate-binding protein
VIANIYLGRINNWADPAIRRLNRGASIPSTPITPFWRSDASGDSYAFSSELSDVSSGFARQVGPSTQPTFPVGQGARANSGMAAALAGTNGGIAYISVAYILANSLPAAGVQNRHGVFAVPNLNDIEAAAVANHSLPASNQVTIVNPPGRAKNAYPFSTYTYVIVPTNARQGALLQSFISYALSKTGQGNGPRLGFAPLPRPVLNRARQTLRSVQ